MSHPAENETTTTPSDNAVTAASGTLGARIGAKWKPLVSGLMLAALLLRIVAAFAVETFVTGADRQFLIEGDANGYWQLAQNIAAGDDYAIHQPPRYVLRTPGFPLLLAASIKCFGNSILAARLVLAVVGTACCWLTYCLGRQLHMRRTGFWAALLVAVNPFHVGNSVLILSETLFTFWMLLSLVALVWLIDSGSSESCEGSQASSRPCGWRLCLRSVLVGALIGATILVRPGFILWLAVAGGVVAFCFKRSRVMRALAVGGIFSGVLIALMPWAARNVSVTGHWVFTSLWSGPSLYDGLNPDADGSSNMKFFDEDAVMAKQGMSEFEMNEHYSRLATDFAVRNPGRVLTLALTKATRFLAPVPNPGKNIGTVFSATCVGMWLFFFGFAAVGLLGRETDCVGTVVAAGPFLLFLLVHMVFVGSVRYRLPVEFPLSVLTAIGWRSLVLTRKKQSSTA